MGLFIFRDDCGCASDPKQTLPSARLVTSKFHFPRNRPHRKLTYMFTQVRKTFFV